MVFASGSNMGEGYGTLFIPVSYLLAVKLLQVLEKSGLRNGLRGERKMKRIVQHASPPPPHTHCMEWTHEKEFSLPSITIRGRLLQNVVETFG